MKRLIITINPGSTSTKTGLFCEKECLEEKIIRHDSSELASFPEIIDQLPYRLRMINEFCEVSLKKHGIGSLKQVSAFVGRGGLIGAVKGGTYQINEDMINVLTIAKYGKHASNLGALIASDFSCRYNKPGYIVDPPSVDEMEDVARITGLKSIKRKSIFHALNQKAAARKAAAKLKREYEQLNLIVCHMGGGISVGAHCRGKVIDVNNALEEGPFSPERAGSLPSISLMSEFINSGLSFNQFYKNLNGKGGLLSLTGSSDVRFLESQKEENSEIFLYLEAMSYQIAKEISSMAAALKGDVQSIVLTGGMAYSSFLCQSIKERIEFIAPVEIIAGEMESEALAAGALRILNNEEIPLIYKDS